VPSSAIGSIFESMPGSVLKNILGGKPGSVLRVYLECTRERLESLLRRVQSSRLGVCSRVQTGVTFRVYLVAYDQ
jgi:hypothetical protein